MKRVFPDARCPYTANKELAAKQVLPINEALTDELYYPAAGRRAPDQVSKLDRFDVDAFRTRVEGRATNKRFGDEAIDEVLVLSRSLHRQRSRVGVKQNAPRNGHRSKRSCRRGGVLRYRHYAYKSLCRSKTPREQGPRGVFLLLSWKKPSGAVVVAAE